MSTEKYRKPILSILWLWATMGTLYTIIYAMAVDSSEAFWCSGWGYSQGTFCDTSLLWLKVITVSFPAMIAPIYFLRTILKGTIALSPTLRIIFAAPLGFIISFQTLFLIALLQWFWQIPCNWGWWCSTETTQTMEGNALYLATLIVIFASFPIYLLGRILKVRV